MAEKDGCLLAFAALDMLNCRRKEGDIQYSHGENGRFTPQLLVYCYSWSLVTEHAAGWPWHIKNKKKETDDPISRPLEF